jgi:hypothetical protein
MQNSQWGLLDATATSAIEQGAVLAAALRLTVETNRILMQERKEILRSQSRTAMQCARELEALKMKVRN